MSARTRPSAIMLFGHSLPGADGTPSVLSRAELYVMGGTDENPMRGAWLQSRFTSAESDSD